MDMIIFKATITDSYISGKVSSCGRICKSSFWSYAMDLLAGISYETFQLPTPDTINTLFSSLRLISFHYRLHVEVGSRYNKHNRYGDNFTYSLNPSYLINGQGKIICSIYPVDSEFHLLENYLDHLDPILIVEA